MTGGYMDWSYAGQVAVVLILALLAFAWMAWVAITFAATIDRAADDAARDEYERRRAAEQYAARMLAQYGERCGDEHTEGFV